ncbi:MAG TPA: hypothetical protein VK573_11630 [Gemmatimonadales bacterium]|nr:hypothetical protein [Gemmatimonadales bacterium]
MICALCGIAVYGGEGEICAHHTVAFTGERWSDGNRIMCDFLHRGVIPARIEGDDDHLYDFNVESTA